MTEQSFYLLSIISIFVSPFVFMLARKKNLVYINFGIIVLFLGSWYWAIHYKLTPDKTYLGEVAFVVMTILVTAVVWMAFGHLLKWITQFSYPKIILSATFLAFSAVLYNLFYYELPTNFDIFYARFHIIFLFLMIISCSFSWIFNKIKNVQQKSS